MMSNHFLWTTKGQSNKNHPFELHVQVFKGLVPWLSKIKDLDQVGSKVKGLVP